MINFQQINENSDSLQVVNVISRSDCASVCGFGDNLSEIAGQMEDEPKSAANKKGEGSCPFTFLRREISPASFT